MRIKDRLNYAHDISIRNLDGISEATKMMNRMMDESLTVAAKINTVVLDRKYALVTL
jgi:hypothetical protein